MSRWLTIKRLMAILIKEFIQMRRDRLTFAMMLAVPLMQLLLFGYAINNDPKRLPTALVMTASHHYTRAIVTALENTGYYRFTMVTDSASEAEMAMATGKVAFVITIPPEFGRRVDRADNPTILIEADATDPASASGAIKTLGIVAQRALQHELGLDAVGRNNTSAALNVVVHQRYNPEGISQYNIIPGLLGIILQMTMVMMTAMALTRETERGTMENLLAMPATPMEIMFGKVLPYFGIGFVQVGVVLTAAKVLFGVPFVGSLTLLLNSIFLFVFMLVLLGYTISTFSRSQMQAMQLTFFVFLPSIMLSGFMFPFRGMPGWAQWIGEALPMTHFLRVIRAIMLKGATWPAVAGEITVLVGFTLVLAVAALSRFRRTLD